MDERLVEFKLKWLLLSACSQAKMESIYFEKQEGLLCAQHCLNTLLQGQYFTAVDLAKIANDLDDEERQRMSESGVDSEEYRKFLQQPSQNMDDSGYFSVQVISKCLSIWGLELVPFGSSSPEAVDAQKKPETKNAYICNYKDHWFTIRKIGVQWFILNSISKGPTSISDTFLSLFLAQLQNEGYSIFLVLGPLPSCEADDMLKLKLNCETKAPPSSPNRSLHLEDEYAMEAAEESEFQRALELSLTARRESGAQDEDDDMRRAIQLSLYSSLSVPSGSGSGLPSGAIASSPEFCEGAIGGVVDEELAAAVRLSLEVADSSHS